MRWDEFNPDKRLCDRYPMAVEVKGGSVDFISKILKFTSNFNVDTWFQDRPNKAAFFRRVTSIKCFGSRRLNTHSKIRKGNLSK